MLRPGTEPLVLSSSWSGSELSLLCLTFSNDMYGVLSFAQCIWRLYLGRLFLWLLII